MSQQTDQSSLTSEDILLEVRKFISESVKKCQRTNVDEVTKGALKLLKNVPAARGAVLEYLRKVFFLAVNRQIPFTEIHSGSNAPDEPTINVTIPEIHNVLIGIVNENSRAWAPLVASWSLDLLGQLSWHYAKRSNLPADCGINEYLKYWSTFRTTKILIDLSANCIKCLSDVEADSCMDVLTESIGTYSPYFDWVVARVGSCFPTLVIKKILLWGLKDFSLTNNLKNIPSSSSSSNLLDSVVGILRYLAGSHLYDIKESLLQLFKWSLDENINDNDTVRKQKIATVPYLLKLASLSSLLLKVITTVVLQTLFPVRPDVIPRLALFATDWCNYFNNKSETLIDLTVDLALACEQGAWQIISILLDTSLCTSNVGYHGVNAALIVKNVCREILELILEEIDLLMRMRGPHNCGIAMLTSIKQDLGLIVPLLLDAQPLRVQTAVKLISLLGAQSPNIIISSASYALRNAKSKFHLAALVCLSIENVVIYPIIKSDPENPLISHGYFTQVVEQALRDIQYTSEIKDDEACQLFKNLSLLLKWENSNKIKSLESKLITRSVYSNLEQIAVLLMKTDNSYLSHSIAKTLDLLNNNKINKHTYSLELTLKLTRAIVRYFFISIKENDKIKKQNGVKIANRLLTLITSNSSCSRVLAIRELLENSIFRDLAKYFGAKEKLNEEKKDFSLLNENHKHGTSVMLAQRHSSVFHAGVIGEGPRRSVPKNNFDKQTIVLNSTLLLEAIKSCCINVDDNNLYPNLEAMTMVSLLLVELVSPDVMYNGLPWPDEEFTKVTIERDLHIRRSFKDIPLLWTLVEFVARHRPSLAYCSVLLRGIAATVISNWDPTEGVRLIDVMSLGQLLPTPLNCLREILPILNITQINTIMRECVWAYMHENVPSPALFTLTEGASIAWRDTDNAIPSTRFTNILRLLLLTNIDKTGRLYATLFYNENK